MIIYPLDAMFSMSRYGCRLPIQRRPNRMPCQTAPTPGRHRSIETLALDGSSQNLLSTPTSG